MRFMVEPETPVADLPYLRAAIDNAGKYLAGKYEAARDMLVLAVSHSPRLVTPPRDSLLAIAGGGMTGPISDPGRKLVRAREGRRRAPAGFEPKRAMRRAFLG
jgi:hypothetical protein